MPTIERFSSSLPRARVTVYGGGGYFVSRCYFFCDDIDLSEPPEEMEFRSPSSLYKEIVILRKLLISKLLYVYQIKSIFNNFDKMEQYFLSNLIKSSSF